MRHPAHPVNERKAAIFHAVVGLLGVAHVVGGLAMCWFHYVAAAKHWRDR